MTSRKYNMKTSPEDTRYTPIVKPPFPNYDDTWEVIYKEIKNFISVKYNKTAHVHVHRSISTVGCPEEGIPFSEQGTLWITGDFRKYGHQDFEIEVAISEVLDDLLERWRIVGHSYNVRIALDEASRKKYDANLRKKNKKRKG